MEARDFSQPGPRVASYKPALGKLLVLSIVLLLLGLPCSIAGFLGNPSPTVYDDTSTLDGLLLTVGIGLLLCGLTALFLTLANRRMRVDVYEQGFVATNKHGTQTVYWQQIIHIWHRLEEHIAPRTPPNSLEAGTSQGRKVSTDVYAIELKDGTTCEIDTSLFGLANFVPILEQQALRVLLPIVLDTYREEGSVQFGTLTVSDSGVTNRQAEEEKYLSWGSFTDLAVDKTRGTITIQRDGSRQIWSVVKPTVTPDLVIFEALVRTLEGQHVSQIVQ